MQTLHSNPRPAAVTYSLAAAWLQWLITVAMTVALTERPALLGVALPTLGTQALLTLGIGWGSNVARMSYFIWSLFAYILVTSGDDVASSSWGWADWASMLDTGLMFATLFGLLLPSANTWFLAQREKNRSAGRYEKLRRAKRNLKVAAAWLAILPLSALIALPVGTPFLAVLASSAIATTVGMAVLLRQSFKLIRLREYAY